MDEKGKNPGHKTYLPQEQFIRRADQIILNRAGYFFEEFYQNPKKSYETQNPRFRQQLDITIVSVGGLVFIKSIGPSAVLPENVHKGVQAVPHQRPLFNHFKTIKPDSQAPFKRILDVPSISLPLKTS